MRRRGFLCSIKKSILCIARGFTLQCSHLIAAPEDVAHNTPKISEALRQAKSGASNAILVVR